MRADLAAPRTWLLATVAGWAALVLALALSGMGGRIEPLPVDPARLADLPRMRPVAASRVGAADQYVQVAARPAFDPGRRPRPFFIENPDGAGSGQGFDFALSSVLISPALQMAILQPANGGEALRVKLGEEPEGSPGWRLAEVNPRSVAFDGPEGRRTLELPVYTGNGQGPLPGGTQVQGAAPKPEPVAAPGTEVRRVQAMSEASAAAPAAAAQAAQAGTDVTSAPERQMQQIRERIEARRAQLRQQQAPAAAPVPSPPPPQR